jgi:hypothetical protein
MHLCDVHRGVGVRPRTVRPRTPPCDKQTTADESSYCTVSHTGWQHCCCRLLLLLLLLLLPVPQTQVVVVRWCGMSPRLTSLTSTASCQ